MVRQPHQCSLVVFSDTELSCVLAREEALPSPAVRHPPTVATSPRDRTAAPEPPARCCGSDGIAGLARDHGGRLAAIARREGLTASDALDAASLLDPELRADHALEHAATAVQRVGSMGPLGDVHRGS
jgi:hypothetical protein